MRKLFPMKRRKQTAQGEWFMDERHLENVGHALLTNDNTRYIRTLL